MKEFRRYKNRKIYDNKRSRYVTIGEVLKDSECLDVIVLDHKDRDITEIVLARARVKVIEKEVMDGSF